jgi:hypothetical protein
MRIWNLVIISCLISLHPYAAQGQNNNPQPQLNKLLRSIIPTETTAEDVKKLLGEPISKSPDFYKFNDFNVLVSYTTGLSCKKESYGWNVPRDRVITFAVILKTAFPQKDLAVFDIDLGEYEKDEDKSGHVPETIYSNPMAGIRIYIIGDQITRIALFPAKKYLHLLCSGADKPPACARKKSAVSLH